MQYQRLFVLDDDTQYVSMLSQMAEIFGVSYQGFVSSEGLLSQKFTDNDLILLDVYMPQDDGLDIIKRLNDIEYCGHLAIMSGAGEDILAPLTTYIETLSINFIGRLDKPVKLADFERLLNSVPKANKRNGMTISEVEAFSKVFDVKSLPVWFAQSYIYPVFQPQVCLDSNLVVGIECLTRVSHPSLSNIQPYTFIKFIESAGLITEYTLLLVKTSLDKVKGILRGNPQLSCSFNVSALSLNAEFIDALVDIVSDSCVPTKQITIELTETSAISMTQSALYAISRLKVSGFPLSIDDFGTGYSSIRQLVELPFNEIKIDRSFISGLEANTKSRTIVNATIDIAKNLNYKLVVEGVEALSQVEYLRPKGSIVVQGFYFSKPLSISALIEFLKEKGFTI